MAAFNNDDGFTTGFLGEKQKNKYSTSNLHDAIFGSQSLNLSDTQKFRTFNQQSNNPDSATFDSSKQKSFDNTSNFTNYISNQFSGNGAATNDFNSSFNNNMNFDNQNMMNGQQMNFNNQDMSNTQSMNFNNQNMSNTQPMNFSTQNSFNDQQPKNEPNFFDVKPLNATKGQNNQPFGLNQPVQNMSNTQQMTFNSGPDLHNTQSMNFNNQNMSNTQQMSFNPPNDLQEVKPLNVTPPMEMSNTQQMNFNNQNMTNTQPMNFGDLPNLGNTNSFSQPLTPVSTPDISNTANITLPPDYGVTGATLSDKKKVNVTKILNISSIVILVILILFVILYSTGVISFKKHNNVTPQEEQVIDPEEQKVERMVGKLNAACNNLDAEGNYGSEPALADETCNVITCYIVNNPICANGLCMISDGNTVYSKVCSTGSLKKVNANDFQANVNLGELCTVLKGNDKLNGTIETSYGTCTNYKCQTTVAGKTYEATCQKNS